MRSFTSAASAYLKVFLWDHFKRLVGAIQFGRALSTRSVHCRPPQRAIFCSQGPARTRWTRSQSDAWDRNVAQTYSKLKEWGVVRDAANVFGRVLSYIRDEDFLGGNKVNGYTAVVSDRPESNPAVRMLIRSDAPISEAARASAVSMELPLRVPI